MRRARVLLGLSPCVRREPYARISAARGLPTTLLKRCLSDTTSPPLPVSTTFNPAILTADSNAQSLDNATGSRSTPTFPDTSSTTSTDIPGDTESQSSSQHVFQIHDLNYIKSTQLIPTQDQYPDAPTDLFDPLGARTILTGICSSRGWAFEVTETYQKKTDLPSDVAIEHHNGIHVYLSTIRMGDLCTLDVLGEGLTKQSARHAGWLQAIADLHSNGYLAQFYPEGALQSPDEIVKPASEVTSEVSNVAIDEQPTDDEKDSLMDIWNYAAGIGVVPEHDFEAVDKGNDETHHQQDHQQQDRKPLFQVTISLPLLDLTASARGATLQAAEVAAAVALKRQLDDHVRSQHVETKPDSKYAFLNMGSANDFVTFYFARQANGDSPQTFRLDLSSTNKAGLQMFTGRVLIGDEQVGLSATGPDNDTVSARALLSAAIYIVNSDPSLSVEFAQRFQIVRSQNPVYLDSVKVDVGISLQNTMRNAILDARAAGLSDASETLSAIDRMEPRRYWRSWPKTPSAPIMTILNHKLKTGQQRFLSDPNYAATRSARETLPINTSRSAILEMVSSNTYSIVAGTTGSGKTTQLPQMLLENEIANNRGTACHIICTQPRRIAAISVARRVAEERQEPLGKSVGYQVRFDSRPPSQPGATITYCTTGVLLEQLKHMPDRVLDRMSHLVIDEVHERDLPIDFLLILIRRALRKRQVASKPIPKVVLMSATLDVDLFAKYFQTPSRGGETMIPCPSINVPGRLFPVHEHYLGDIIHDLMQRDPVETRFTLNLGKSDNEYLKYELDFASQQTAATTAAPGVGEEDASSSEPLSSKSEPQDPPDITSFTSKPQTEKEDAMVPCALMAATIAHIGKIEDDGSILAFLPGFEEINQTRKLLLDRSIFGLDFNDTSKWRISRLHSTIPKEDQMEIFEPLPPGCRRIMLSTNIAETSITVPNVKYVIDAGKIREKRYDQMRRSTQLQCVWESKSNARQRAGRAGRVQHGHYYALFSQERHAALSATGVAQLLRSDLQSTCLAIKAQDFDDSVAEFLAEAIEPPSSLAVDMALINLKNIEALTYDEKLTKLGRVLSRLPVHPTLGKMIILGVIFRCLDPMLIFGAAFHEPPLFMSPILPEARRAVLQRRYEYAGEEVGDQFATLQAFREMRVSQRRSGTSATWARCREAFIHYHVFKGIDQTAQHVMDILIDVGLLPSGTQRDWDGVRGLDDDLQYGPRVLNENSNNSELIKALLVSGTHPNLAVRNGTRKNNMRTPGEFSVMALPKSLNFEGRRQETATSSDTSSKSAKSSVRTADLPSMFIFNELTKNIYSKKLYMCEVTAVTPLMAALFGGTLRQRGPGLLEMDDWLPIRVRATNKPFAAKLLLEFRKALDRVLHNAFRDLSSDDHDDHDDGVNDSKDGTKPSMLRLRRGDHEAMRERFTTAVVEILDQAK